MAIYLWGIRPRPLRVYITFGKGDASIDKGDASIDIEQRPIRFIYWVNKSDWCRFRTEKARFR